MVSPAYLSAEQLIDFTPEGLCWQALLSPVLAILPAPFGDYLPFVAAVVFGYLGMAIMVMRQRDIFNVLGGRLPGRSGHSSDPSLGINALDGMHQAMSELIAWRGELQARYRNPLSLATTELADPANHHDARRAAAARRTDDRDSRGRRSTAIGPRARRRPPGRCCRLRLRPRCGRRPWLDRPATPRP